MDKEEVIVVENLYKSFDKNPILRGINLTLHKGENLGIMGNQESGNQSLSSAS